MELKLNVYKKREIIKTYTCDTYKLMLGTVEDFLELINVDELKTGSDAEIGALVVKSVPKGMSMFKTLLKDVFEGISDEELRNTSIDEITQVLVSIVKYSIAEIGIGIKQKN